jgi:hypothetical protein
MKTKIQAYALLVFLILSHEAFPQKGEVMKWMVGTWTLNTRQGMVVEHWKQVNDSTLKGKSVMVKVANDTLLQEVLELTLRNGPIIFLRGTEFISENPNHDFPQRITYRRIKNQLFASIEGKKSGRYNKVNFDFMYE